MRVVIGEAEYRLERSSMNPKGSSLRRSRK